MRQGTSRVISPARRGLLYASLEDETTLSSGSRRKCLQISLQSFILSTMTSVGFANAAMKSDQNVFKVGKDLTDEEALARFNEGRKSLKYLLDNFDQICTGGGDNIRRYLGTVGTTSGLWGISKVMRSLQDKAEDVIEFTETMNEVDASLRGADSAAYMAIFVSTSSSSTPPEKYFEDARIESKRALQAMNELAEQIDMK